MMDSCSIVIPVYKSSKSIEILVEQIIELGNKLEQNFEVILVNDSPFFLDTVQSLKRLTEKYPSLITITLRKNQGQHVALLVGLKKATGQYVITMDDDLQHPVNEIPKLLAAIKENKKLEVVFGVPALSQKKHSFWRNMGSYFINNKADSFIDNAPEEIRKSAFRIMTRDVKEIILKNYNAMPAVSSLLVNATSQVANVEVEHKERLYGKSQYTLRKLISLSLNSIIYYSAWPLKALGALGVFGFSFSMIFILYTLFQKLFWGISFPGYASTVILISFFGGLNLLAVGIIGEYLIRILREQQKWDLDDYIKEID
ncbi:MAG: glycosyltransferase [Bacteroidetes bacterium]|jgi:dolichol-phosphate mannosyltransferase/undecaprenyl-phosphate 4-deoxy-4-formamido-L-arabinose transferase|nr:glycosyltransferase [Bacteroidota bacterium]